MGRGHINYFKLNGPGGPLRRGASGATRRNQPCNDLGNKVQAEKETVQRPRGRKELDGTAGLKEQLPPGKQGWGGWGTRRPDSQLPWGQAGRARGLGSTLSARFGLRN